MLKNIFIFAFILFAKQALCQTPVYFSIGEKEFANTDVYTVLYDENTDLIYAGTNNGLYVYKQNEFRLLAGPNEQVGNSFFSLKQNVDGDVFCKNFNGQIFKINSETNSYSIFYELPKDNLAEGLIWYNFTSENEFVVVTSYEVIIDPCNKKKSVLNHNRDNNFTIRNCHDVNGTIYIHLNDTKDGSRTIYSYNHSELEIVDKVLFEEFENVKIGEINYFSGVKNKPYYITFRGNFLSNDQKIIPNFKAQEKERYEFINDSTFVGLNAQKGYRYLNLRHDKLEESPMMFPNLFVSSFYQTSDNIQLLGTFGSGVLVLPNPGVIKKKHDFLFLGIATSPDNKVAVSTRSGEVFLVKEENIELIEKVPVNVDHVWYAPGNFDIKKNVESDFIYERVVREISALKDVIVINDSVLVFVHTFAVLLKKHEKYAKVKNIQHKQVTNKNQFCLVNGERYFAVEWNENDSLLYYVSNSGVYSRGLTDSIDTPYLYNNKKFLANDILVYKNDLVCATTNYGVLFYDGFKIVAQISDKNGLKSNNVDQIYVKDNLLFILNKEGFQMYDLKLKAFVSIGISEGIIQEEVTRFAVSDDKLWLLEKHGYYDVDISDLFLENTDVNISNLYLDSISVNGESIVFNTENMFDFSQNHFEFYYDYRNIVTKQEVKIFYKLEGFYDEWKQTSAFENKVEFQYLPPGDYEFKVKVKFRNNQQDVFNYHFEITPPFWKTWWFFTIFGLILISSIVIYFNNRIKKIKKDDLIKLEKQMLLTDAIDFKLKALRSQMNPHFIFNSLNSIQALILKQDIEKSYDYVVMFSELVRKTLEYSDQDFIDIEDELKFLEIYLKLESLRMKTDFKYNISYKGDKEIKIPSLMVQPFIENAIHHGLLHKTGEKNLDVLFEFGTEMKCTVTDNGIGRKKSAEIKKRQNARHKSFSLEATKERMKMIEQKHGSNYGYQFFDMYDNDNSLGTIVVLTLPFKFGY